MLAASLAIMWANYGLTARWAHVAGSLHGPKEPIFLALLLAATVAVCLPWKTATASVGWLAPVAGWAGLALLTFSFFQWFPFSTWDQYPFLDNWSTRIQTTIDQLDLFKRGVGVGWTWAFLGGYHSSSDISQTLSAIGALPMLLLGERVGFHLVHLLVLLALPTLVWIDCRLEADDREMGALAAGLVALTVTGWFSFYMTRSGDTNSMAGTFCAVAALTGSHAAARGRRWGAPLLVGAMALLGYCHTAFVIFTSGLLVLEAIFYWDARRLLRALPAIACAVVAALPLTWESWRHADYFTISNADYPSPPFELAGFLRKVYYNIEILFRPGRWFNDFTGLARVMTPALLLVAWTGWRRRSRAGFYAWAAFSITGIMLLNSPIFGFAFLRPIHLLAVLPAAALAGFLVRLPVPRALMALLVALAAAYLQITWMQVPHVAQRRDLDPVLVERVKTLDGALILFENTFHRDLDGDPTRETEKTPFSSHFEAFLGRETGKRFYAGLWDGWQWSVFKTNLLSGGAFRGRLVTTWSGREVRAELRRWGVRHLLVWSRPATAFFAGQEGFARRWTHGRWTQFEMLDADPREVVVGQGSGRLANLDRLSADVVLQDVKANDLVVLRTNYYPEWRAAVDGVPVPLSRAHDQMAFRAPRDGSYTVNLTYPRRYWLNFVAAAAILLALLAVVRVPAGERRQA